MIKFANSSIVFSAYAEADFFGKIIFLSLFLVSLICWVVLIHQILQTKKVKRLSFAFENSFEMNKEHLLSLNFEQMPQPKRLKTPHPYGKIFSSLKEKTLEILKKNHYFAKKEEKRSSENAIYLSPNDLELIESHVLTTISKESKYLEKNLFILSTIVTLAPFLGLLGTVWGILMTFSGLQSGAGMSSNSMILGGLSTALATTVLGLIIAIPALISHNYLKNQLKHYCSDMEDFLCRLLSTIELQYRNPNS